MRANRRSFAIICGSAAVLMACAKAEAPAADSAVVATPVAEAPPAATPFALADAAGAWSMTSTPMTGDATPTRYVLTAGATTEGWTMKLPNRPAVPVRVTVSGDSVLTSAGPYESVRRKGVQVTTDGVLWLRGDSLTGKTIAHYKTSSADSVLELRTAGVRSK